MVTEWQCLTCGKRRHPMSDYCRECLRKQETDDAPRSSEDPDSGPDSSGNNLGTGQPLNAYAAST